MIGNGDFLLKEGDDINYKDVEGKQFTKELESEIQIMADRAAKKISNDLRLAPKALFMSFGDMFCIRLEKDLSVSFPTIVIKLDGTGRPTKVRQRTFSPEQQTFLKKSTNIKMAATYTRTILLGGLAPH